MFVDGSSQAETGCTSLTGRVFALVLWWVHVAYSFAPA